jgi:flagellar protein FlgJ
MRRGQGAKFGGPDHFGVSPCAAVILAKSPYRSFTGRPAWWAKSIKYGESRMEITSQPVATARASAGGDAPLYKAAKALEGSFLAEMLKSAGLGKPPDGFGGGAGEDQFSSFLVDEEAKQMVAAGGIGLARSIFEAMKERGNGG